jgi:hypothetical protein
MRLSTRMTVSLQVDWCVAGAATHVISTLGNMSSHGAYVSTAVPAPAGAVVQMNVLTGVGGVPARARVMWEDGRGMGLRFAGASDPRE